MPPGIHAGGLRYHGMAPSVSVLVDAGLIDAVAVKQRATFEAAVQFARAEGIILFNFSGNGNFDMVAYETYLSGKLEDYEYPEEAIKESMSKLSKGNM